MKNQLPHLFQKGQIGKLELRNRIVLPPMGLMFVEDFVNDRLIDFHVERAKGGAGLIIVSAAYTDVQLPIRELTNTVAIWSID